MKMLKALSIAITLLLLLPAASAQAPQWKNADYDAVRDFSIQSNPNGVWSYGWTSSLGSPLNLYTVADTTTVPGMSAWLESGTFPDNPPYVAHNGTDKKICGIGWCAPPAYLHVHPGQGGELTVVRWVAPSTGKFRIEGAFEGLDPLKWGPATTDIHVLVNSSKSLLAGPITSYKWPLTFNLTVKVSAGDTVDFAVGFGKNGNWYGDSTGVRFAVTRLGKP
jgi:hypothetical protein